MRAFAAVFTRELFERRFVFLVAFLAGFVPLIGSGLYGWSTPDAAEGRVLVALVGATALSAAFALLLGAAVIVGDTREKRISFYFSRPIPSASLWAGKLLAAIAITLATAFLAFTPGWLSGNGRARNLWGLDATPGRTALAALALAVVFVLGSHAVVTVARLRSPWVALDLILAPTLIFLAAVFLQALLREAFTNRYASAGQIAATMSTVLVALGAAILLALLAASLAQVVEGRTDARRAHGAFSVVFFGILGCGVALLGGYAWWCASARATDLASISDAGTAPRGRWVTVAGPLRAGRLGGSFLFDPSSGRSLKVRSFGAFISQDGARASWCETRIGFFEKGNRYEMYVADLSSGKAFATGMPCAGAPPAFSPSGNRLSFLDGGTLAVYDVSKPENPKQMFASQTDAGSALAMAFVDEDTVRLFPRVFNARTRSGLTPESFEITEFSLPSKKSLVTGRFDRESLPYLRLSADGRYFVGSRKTRDAENESVLALYDGRTGAPVATLASGIRSAQARFLTGNRIAVAGIEHASARLFFYEAEKGGAGPARSIALGPAARVALGGEIAPGRVVVALNASDQNDEAAAHTWKALSVEASTGAIASLGEGLVPANRYGWWSNAVLPPAEAGSPAATLFLDAESRLVRLDPATGARTVILGKGK